jgi:isopenicillin-N epimerase
MRDLFLLDPDLVFLNHGSFGACPKDVLEDQRRWQLEMERNPVAFLGRRSADLLSQARWTLGAALGARGADLIFVPNSTTGVNIVAQSLPLQPGDEVLTTDLEYGACDAAWSHVCAKRGAGYHRVEIPLPYDREGVVDRLMGSVTPVPDSSTSVMSLRQPR